MRDAINNYEKLYVPLLDVYRFGGLNVFHELANKSSEEKNGLILPKSFFTAMYHLKEEGGGDGFHDSTETVSALMNEASQKDSAWFMTANPGLDVILIDDELPLNFQSRRFQFPLEQFFTGFSSGKLQSIRKNLEAIMTRDSFSSTLAKMHGLPVQEPGFLRADPDNYLLGIIDGDDAMYQLLMENSTNPHFSIPANQASDMLNGTQLFSNQFIRFGSGKNVSFARVHGDKTPVNEKFKLDNLRVQMIPQQELNQRKLRVGNHVRREIFGIECRYAEQYLAMQYALLDPDVRVVILSGVAGSGKTLLSYVAGLDQTLIHDPKTAESRLGSSPILENAESLYRQLVLLKSTQTLGGYDLGALPGDLLDKLEPHLKPFLKAHGETIFDSHFGFEQGFYHPLRQMKSLPRRRQIKEINTGVGGSVKLPERHQLFDLTYAGIMRGDSIGQSYYLIDEAQNYPPYVMHALLTRPAFGTKTVICGDVRQIDSPDCSPGYNGMSWAIKELIDRPYTALIHLPVSCREWVSEDIGQLKVYSGKRR
ncbi:MAG: PhoH family protein [Candidatus Woesearchaeota archaeon]